jgi:monoamine oxidase
MPKKVSILGAGLSGLLIAKRLKTLGFSITVLEARERLGGRIYTKRSVSDTPVELGATWFGAQHQQLIHLLDELNVGYYEQYMKGTALFEAFSMAPPQHFDLPQDSTSYRIKGGTSALIDTLASSLTEEEIRFNAPVVSLDFSAQKCRISTKSQVFESDIVISTLPPALFVNHICVVPELPQELKRVAEQTHTWMQDSTKVAVIYERPFWRERGISGTVFSQVGPFTELYDQCNFEVNRYALCGFIGGGYAYLSSEKLIQKIKEQLVKLFGDEAKNYLKIEIGNWGQELYTKHPNQNQFEVYAHQNNGHPIFQEPMMSKRLFFGGTETASMHPGYMEGAVIAAGRVVKQVVNAFK